MGVVKTTAIMGWVCHGLIVSSSNPYVEHLIPHVVVFDNGVFEG